MKSLLIASFSLLILTGCGKGDTTPPVVKEPTPTTEQSVTTEGPQESTTIEMIDTGATQNVGSVFETSTEGLTPSSDSRPSSIRQ